MTNIIKSTHIATDLADALNKINYDRLFVLTDQHTRHLCLPIIASCQRVGQAHTIMIPANDDHKTLDNLAFVWQQLSNNGATRHSLLINLGGGMVTDIGGFAAATFKRGIAYINVPTTLLGAVDAAGGGKTGINFNGYKNEVGAFYDARFVIISSEFFKTLNRHGILSGYAEMLKHALISSPDDWQDLLTFSFDNINYSRLTDLTFASAAIKQSVVEKDPFEKALRKALNLGHTVGHAFESFALAKGTPVLHGYSVAWGLIAELYLSHRICGFPADKLQQAARYIYSLYGAMPMVCDDYSTLYSIMTHDKKNENGIINFTLLSDIGRVQINCTASREQIFESLDFYRDTVGV